jgi:hypothetical protein
VPSLTLHHPRDDRQLWRPYSARAFCFPLECSPKDLFPTVGRF